MLDYLTKIKPLEDARKTDAEIAEALSSFTEKGISPKSVREYFRDNELWYPTPRGWAGKLQDIYDDETSGDAIVKVLGNLWTAAFTNSVDSIETTIRVNRRGKPTRYQPAKQILNTFSRLIQQGKLTQDEVDGLYDLGGGLADPDVDEAKIAAARTAHINDEKLRIDTEVLQQQWAEMQNDGGINVAVASGDRAALVTALRAAADSLEAA